MAAAMAVAAAVAVDLRRRIAGTGAVAGMEHVEESRTTNIPQMRAGHDTHVTVRGAAWDIFGTSVKSAVASPYIYNIYRGCSVAYCASFSATLARCLATVAQPSSIIRAYSIVCQYCFSAGVTLLLLRTLSQP